MSTNSNADPPDETQDNNATVDGEEAVAAEQESNPNTAAKPDVEAPDEDADAEADTAAADEDTADVSADGKATRPPAQFKAAINGGPLKTALKTVSTLVDETRFHIDESGIQIRAVDPANIAMTDLTLGAAAFESYTATAGVLGVDLDRLEEKVKLANKGDLVQLALDQETGKLCIHIDELEFTMACLDPETIRAEPDIPELDLSGEVIVEESDVDRAVTAADMVSDHIRLGVDPDADHFYVIAEGDTDEVRLELERDDVIMFGGGEADALFSLEYLKDMNRAIPTGTEVTLELSEAFPLVLEYGFADGDGHVTQMLAPRIKTD